MVFIDVRTAYDNINRRRLYGILAQQGITRKILDLKEGVSDDGTSEDTGGTTEVFEVRSRRNKRGGPTPLLCTLVFD